MHWTSNSQILFADIPDPSVIRVGDTYYMTSTTMYFTPGCPVMKSKNLRDWELIGYVYETLNDSDHMTLQNGKHDYGRGSWASCLRYNKGVFYVSFVAYNTGKTYIFKTRDIEGGVWERHVIDGIYHDMSILFDDDGRVYMVYGAGAIKMVELTADATEIKPSGMSKTIIENADPTGGNGLAEGAHIYKLHDAYYIFIIAWPKTGNRRRIQVCYRATTIDGDYENRIVLDDTMGFQNAGVAQGGIVDTPDGEWYAMLFQDHGAVGRVPVLVPVEWSGGWPVFGKPELLDCSGVLKNDFLHSQWNHNPVNSHWLYEAHDDTRLGRLRLTALPANSLSDARNTLTLRTFGPMCVGEATLNISGMRDGDFAGIAAFQDQYAYIGVKMCDGKKYAIQRAAAQTENNYKIEYTTGQPEKEITAIPLTQDRANSMRNRPDGAAAKNRVFRSFAATGGTDFELIRYTIHLKIIFDFTDARDEADFFYSLDGREYKKIGNRLKMSYRLSHFTGYRFALFNFATAKGGGGYVDFTKAALRPYPQ
ncbi:MAG: glycoside hydrolase 43 family protein [Defluviitaleaceae bacterium]|nr:glycoside hydrolase 43 family protein [Defluviitaleaceae bacterium]